MACTRPAAARSSRIDVGEAETEAFWTDFLRGLVARGLVGVQLAISDAHAGLKAAIAKVLGLRLAALHGALPPRLPRARPQGPARPAGRADPPDLQRRLARAGARSALRSRRAPRRPARQGRRRCSKTPKHDILAFYAFPSSHWRKLRSTNPLERFNREVGRRTDVVGIFPDDRSLIRLAGMLCIEQNDCHEGRAGRAGGPSSPRRRLGARQQPLRREEDHMQYLGIDWGTRRAAWCALSPGGELTEGTISADEDGLVAAGRAARPGRARLHRDDERRGLGARPPRRRAAGRSRSPTRARSRRSRRWPARPTASTRACSPTSPAATWSRRVWVPPLDDRAIRERLRRRSHLIRLRTSSINRTFGLLTQWGLRRNLTALRKPGALDELAEHGVPRGLARLARHAAGRHRRPRPPARAARARAATARPRRRARPAADDHPRRRRAARAHDRRPRSATSHASRPRASWSATPA